VLVFAVAGGVKVIVNQRIGPGMQRQKPRFLALVLDFQMRHAAAGMPEIRYLELAELFARSA
jgi:hypothetical protein